MLNSWLDFLVDPVARRPLRRIGGELVADNGVVYPIVDGIPVLLRKDAAHTLDWSFHTDALVRRVRDGEVIDVVSAAVPSVQEREQVEREIAMGLDPAEAVIRRYIWYTSGNAYRDRPLSCPIPIPRFPQSGDGDLLLDIGCNWGRWTIAASRAGFRVIGIDPMLDLLLTAKRFSARQGIDATFVCADTRFLPFVDHMFDRAFSYGVLQHFSDEDCETALREVGRTLKPNGASLVQMAHSIGARSLWVQAGRGFRKPPLFDVRYRSLSKMFRMFTDSIGPTSVSIDCFFGLGLQASDIAYMGRFAQAATIASEALKRAARFVPLHLCADSVFMHSARPA
jgi:SAM-dependent methyltransferase